MSKSPSYWHGVIDFCASGSHSIWHDAGDTQAYEEERSVPILGHSWMNALNMLLGRYSGFDEERSIVFYLGSQPNKMH